MSPEYADMMGRGEGECASFNKTDVNDRVAKISTEVLLHHNIKR
jgi:hypothetical protein